MSFDESLLDDADLLARRDAGRLLWALATAGAQVRHAASVIGEFAPERLAGQGTPRALLVATDAAGAGSSRVLARLAAPSAPSIAWNGPDLPRWAGPADALLVASLDGRHPRLVGLVEQGVHRGLAVAVVAPAGSPAAEAAGRAPVAELAADLHRRAARWSLLTPLLQAATSLGVITLPDGLLAQVADALDVTAESCRPTGDSLTNPAKSMAIEFAETVPLIAGAGVLAGVAARLVSDTLQLFAGTVAVPVGLPDGVAAAGAVLRGSPQESGDDDFFHDRESDLAVRRPRLLIIGDEGDPDDPALGPRSSAELQLDEVAARRAAAALHGIATQRGLRSSTVDVPHGPPLARFAAATAFGDFTATYLALGLGIDPSEPLPGELPH